MVAVGVLLGVVLYRWARDLWGENVALWVLGLYAFSPNFLAHTRLVTTDVGVACFSVAALYLLWRHSWSWRRRDALGAGIGLGLALLAKYSGVVTAAVMVTLLCAAALIRPVPWRKRLTGLGRAAGWILVPAALLVTAGFDFPFGIPNYLRGFSIIHADRNPYWSAFLWGEHSADGFWYYYLLAQWWKTPIPTLLLFAASLLSLRGGLDRRRALDWGFLLLPVIAFHAAAAIRHPSIGIRHVLPVFPFVFLAAGYALQRARTRVQRGVVAALATWYVAGTLNIHPNYLSYFNELAGGPEGGIRYLVDSDLDWGQDYVQLAEVLEDRFPGPVKMSAFAPVDPSVYGIDWRPMELRDLVLPESGVSYVVGAGQLQARSLYAEYSDVSLDWLERYQPVARAGWSLLIYRFATDPEAADRTGDTYVPEQIRRQHAEEWLRDTLARHPDFGAARTLLVQLETGS